MSFNDSLAQFTVRLRRFIYGPLQLEARSAVAANGGPGEDRFDQLAFDLFANQYNRNSAYRKICDARNVSPAIVNRWMDIPAVPASAFKELDLTCLPQQDRPTVFYSSGTTAQEPSRHYHNSDSLSLYEDSLLAWFRHRFLPELAISPAGREQLAILTPSPTQAPHSSLVHMFETIRRAYKSIEAVYFGKVAEAGAWTLESEELAVFLRGAASEGRPVLLFGTAFLFVRLLDFMAEQGLSFELPRESLVLETGGYKGRSRILPRGGLHKTITQRLGISPLYIVSEYGMSELSSQAYDMEVGNSATAPATRVFHFPPWARARIVSPETGMEVDDGETGLIRVFDLANVYSVMAIQTEDLGIRRGGGFELIGRAVDAEPRGCSLMAA